MVVKPESSSQSQQSIHSQATLSSNTRTAGDTVPVTHLGLVRLLGAPVHLSHHTAQHQQKRKNDSMFRYHHKEIEHERFTLTCFNMQLLGTLICSREEVAQPGWERHWLGCSPLYVIRTVCQALGQVAVDVQLRQPVSRGEGRVMGGEGHPAGICVLPFHTPPGR